MIVKSEGKRIELTTELNFGNYMYIIFPLLSVNWLQRIFFGSVLVYFLGRALRLGWARGPSAAATG